MRIKLSDITKYSKGTQINGDNLIEDGEFIYLNGGINPSGRWDSSNVSGNTVTISEGGNSSGYVNYILEPFWCGAHCYYLYDGPKNSKYLFYALKSQQDRLFSIRSGACMPNIKKTDLGNFEFEYDADESKQNEVVSVLTKVESVIAERKKELDLLDGLIKARFVEMFNLDDVQWGTYGANTDFVDYRGHTPELSDDGTIRMVNAKSVGKGYFKFIDEFVTESVYDSWMHRGFGYPGDVLFVTEGHTFGNACLVPESLKKFALGQRVITIKGHKDKLTNAFIYAYMQTDRFWQDINVYRTGGTAQGIRSKDLIKVRLPLPSMELQKRFQRFVAHVDKSKFLEANYIIV